MSAVIAWMAAEAEKMDIPPCRKERDKGGATRPAGDIPREFPGDDENPHFSQNQGEVGHPPAHQFPQPEVSRCEEQERRVYRGRTVAMLRRYLRYSIETGRLPSLLGREWFRAKVTSYSVVTFEDRVIFVHDMEMCLERLDEFSREIIARHILQEHDQAATGRLLHCTERTVRTYIPIALDLLSDILLEVGLMERVERNAKISCQGGLEDEILVSDCEHGKNKGVYGFDSHV